MAGKKDGPPATCAEIEALPPNLVGEIVDDQLFASPRPASPYAFASSGLSAAILGPFLIARATILSGSHRIGLLSLLILLGLGSWFLYQVEPAESGNAQPNS